MENEDTGKDQELKFNPKRSPFKKLDNKRRNLHSPDVKRDEIASGDPTPDFKERERLQREPWKEN